MSDDRGKRERRQAEIWQQIEAYRQELRRSGPDTIEAYERATLISQKIDKLEAEYGELGGILHDVPGDN